MIFLLIIFLKIYLIESSLEEQKPNVNCDSDSILFLINDNLKVNDEKSSFIELQEEQNEQQLSGYKIKENYEYRFSCVTKSNAIQLERITIFYTNNQRKILKNQKKVFFDKNNETIIFWFSVININELNFTIAHITCAHYNPLECSKDFYPRRIGDKIDFYKTSEKINEKQLLVPFIWIICIVAVLTSVAIGLRLIYSARQKKHFKKSSLRRIYKPKNSKNDIFKPSKSSSKKNSINRLTELNDINTVFNNNMLNDDVEIPIIYESNENNLV
jgi:hypothetical protein